MSIAFLFPGQGAQSVGMGKDLYDAFAAARAVFDRAEDISGLPLKRLCFEGPDDQLARTDIAQPAIFATSAAMLATLGSLLSPQRIADLRPAFMAGLSLGEYTALYAAGMIGFDDAMRLVTRRGAAMQAAATAVPSGMVAVTGLDEPKARELCAAAAQGQVLTCANFNSPGQIVVSGELEACRRVEAMAGQFGASGAVALKVAGAFHSEIMQPAARELGQALAAVGFAAPAEPAAAAVGEPATPAMGQSFASAGVKVIANVSAQPYACHRCAAENLLAQLCGAVRWQQSVEHLISQGVTQFYEVGPGRVLAGLMRRIDRKAAITSINNKEAVEKLVDGLTG
jgi:[acyl-carrier-protein] S-malonyltransferase